MRCGYIFLNVRNNLVFENYLVKKKNCINNKTSQKKFVSNKVSCHHKTSTKLHHRSKFSDTVTKVLYYHVSAVPTRCKNQVTSEMLICCFQPRETPFSKMVAFCHVAKPDSHLRSRET